MGISDFVDTESRVVKFHRLKKKCKSQAEIRKLERTLLKPESLPTYTGEEAEYEARHPASGRSVTLVFPDDDSIKMFEEVFNVSHQANRSVSNIRPFMAILREFKRGKIRYDKEKDKVLFIKKRKRTKRNSS